MYCTIPVGLIANTVWRVMEYKPNTAAPSGGTLISVVHFNCSGMFIKAEYSISHIYQSIHGIPCRGTHGNRVALRCSADCPRL